MTKATFCLEFSRQDNSIWKTRNNPGGHRKLARGKKKIVVEVKRTAALIRGRYKKFH